MASAASTRTAANTSRSSRRGATTPAPWINVIANPGFGFQVSAEGSGYTWAENSRENQITPWSNDPVEDPAGEAFYVRDEMTGALWCATAQPIRDDGTYIARHGYGYSRFEHEANGIALDLLQFVPLADSVKISRLTLRNLSGVPRRLSVTAWMEWVLGTSRGASGPFITTEIDRGHGRDAGAQSVEHRHSAGASRSPTSRGQQTAWTADRTEFLGRHGGPAAPAALTGKAPLSGATGAGLDPCAALQGVIELGVGRDRRSGVRSSGNALSVEEARALIERYRKADLDAVLAEVTRHWQTVLGTVQVKTPDRAMDLMLNGWLLYQTLACRIWARSAFYQASGAYGFRDQLQDGMALTHAQPDETRRHLLRAASRQFVEGDVQHWWLPHSGQGVRTRISDDRVWLAYRDVRPTSAARATPRFSTRSCRSSMDRRCRPGEHDAFFQPMIADESASLFEHCARGLDQCIELTGEHGLPLIGTGDWNDGMNRVGAGGKGESVWLGWLLLRTIDLFAPLAQVARPSSARRAGALMRRRCARRWSAMRGTASGIVARRLTTARGSVRSKATNAGSIRSRSRGPCCQARPIRRVPRWRWRRWRSTSSAATTGLRCCSRRRSTRHRTIPAISRAIRPGCARTAGSIATRRCGRSSRSRSSGDGDKAAALFSLLNPVNHARTPMEVDRYKVEPYVVAADVYSVAPHVGRGGWTWYTGSAGWMYRAGVEGILGIRREGDFLVIDPCIPDAWPGFRSDGQYAIDVL